MKERTIVLYKKPVHLAAGFSISAVILKLMVKITSISSHTGS